MISIIQRVSPEVSISPPGITRSSINQQNVRTEDLETTLCTRMYTHNYAVIPLSHGDVVVSRLRAAGVGGIFKICEISRVWAKISEISRMHKF